MVRALPRGFGRPGDAGGAEAGDNAVLGIGDAGHQGQVALEGFLDRNAGHVAGGQGAQARGAGLVEGRRVRQQQARDGVVIEAFDLAGLE